MKINIFSLKFLMCTLNICELKSIGYKYFRNFEVMNALRSKVLENLNFKEQTMRTYIELIEHTISYLLSCF